MKLQFVDFEGKRVPYYAHKEGSSFWIHIHGQTHLIDLKPKPKTGGAAVGGGDGKVNALMPGKILKCNVGAQTPVKPTDVVIVMEAMKMEYSLVAGVDGVVERVQCQAGDMVEAGQLLVQIRPNMASKVEK
jgi:acetyl/propionyl-CoA carboxylase alpha subunit